MINKLISGRNKILFIELAGLLHDIGKLSKAFLEYRQKWQDLSNGWNIDPHEKDYLGSREVFINLIPSEFENYKIPVDIDSGKQDFSIKRAIDFHIKPGNELILQMLKAADGLDSAIDRNNPLWSSEQKDKIFKSNVFGYEGNRIITVESQEKARQELYAFFGSRLTDYFEHFDSEARWGILKGIKKAFDQGLADTTRPQNDTTLWEHSYAVASILKVLVVHYILRGEILDNSKTDKKIKFGILGIGWDGLRFLSYGQKIGDIVGRQKVIENTKRCLKDLIEYKYPIGNEIYSDDDGIYFIVPTGLNDDKLKELRTEIEDKVYKIATEVSGSELQPYIVEISETNTLTSLIRAIREMKEKVSYPFDSSINEFHEYFKGTLETSKNGKTVCPICRLRSVEKEDEKKKACNTCKGRRIQNDKNEQDECRPKNNETLFIDEIVDKKRKAALIVARFGLDVWLNGRMVRSLFVTEANGIEREVGNLGNVKHFEADERRIKEFLENKNYGKFNYSRIKADIDSIFEKEDKERAKNIAFLYDRRNVFNPDIERIKSNWERLLESAKKEDALIDIYNMINAKTPTPSTVLDVWNTTFMFFEDNSRNILKGLLPENRRLRLKVKPVNSDSLHDWGKRALEAEVLKTAIKRIELLYIEKNTVELIGELFSDRSDSEWKGRQFKITDSDYTASKNAVFKIEECLAGNLFVPFRTITATPNLFISIVPADRAVEITDLIYQKYIGHFGKVMGRLPFSIGNIFFDRKMPMFVVLDAGKRMVNNFDKLSKEGIEVTVLRDKEKIASGTKFDLKCTLGKSDKTLTWRLPSSLGNCDDDFHHPYFIVDNKKGLLDDRKTFFKTVAGYVVHFSDIKAGDEITVLPNYYDFEFLDSNTRRHDINLDAGKRRKSNVSDFNSKPFLLDELGQKIMCLWSKLIQGKQLKGITDTKLRNLQSLWLTKHQEWVREDNPDGIFAWKDLVACSIQKEFSIDKDSQEHSSLMETIENGLFFDTLELYLGILKERIDTK